MIPKLFKELLNNLPDSIDINGFENQGNFEFDKEIEIIFSCYKITVEINGGQSMKFTSGEDEVNLSEGWEINRDAPVLINEYLDLDVFMYDVEMNISLKQSDKLIDAIEKLIYLQL